VNTASPTAFDAFASTRSTGVPFVMHDPDRTSLTVLLADDHALVRQGLKRIIDSEPGLRVAAQAVDGPDTLAALQREAFGIVLLDLSMPAPSGVDLIRLIREQHPAQRMLVVSMHNNPHVARAAIDAGAHGYVTKDSDPEVLLHALRLVAAGGCFMEPRLMQAILFAPDAAAPASLSPRETEVLRRLAAGQGNNQIARDLFLSEKTVSTHRARLRTKLGLNSLADLVRYAQEHLPDTST
jgi:DNA-binding NarL/FixJ family response regulator